MEITLKDLKELIGNNNISSSLDNIMNGKYCIIRTYSAGVHCGYVEAHGGDKCLLKDARRIWSWEGAFTLNKIATSGFKSAKMPVAVPEIVLVGVIEIIPVNSQIIDKLINWDVHNG